MRAATRPAPDAALSDDGRASEPAQSESKWSSGIFLDWSHGCKLYSRLHVDLTDNTQVNDYFGMFDARDTVSETNRVLQSVVGAPEQVASEPIEVGATDSAICEYRTRSLMQMCFPTLFPDGCGGLHAVVDKETRRYQYELADFCSHLMSWHDRRFVTHRTFKFFYLNLMQRRQIDGVVRRVPSGQHQVGSTLNGGATAPIEHASKSDDKLGSREREAQDILKQLKPYFKCVRGFRLYWSDVRDDLMDMIGSHALPTPWPTFFFTLSAADTVWPDFFRVCNPALSWREASRLCAFERKRYLNEYPDLASQHFYRRFKALFDSVLHGLSEPLGKITDYFWRVEFQKRGSPHIHGLLWVADVPDIIHLSETEEGRAQLAEYVDLHISAHSVPLGEDGNCLCGRHNMSGTPHEVDILAVCPEISPEDVQFQCEIGRIVDRVQEHRCAAGSSCREKKGTCRFDFPKPLRSHTEVEAKTSANGALSLSIHLERDSAFTNNYCPELLYLWRANMDIKLVGNAYGAAEYTAAYVSKSEPDTPRFRNAIAKALEKAGEQVEHYSVLKRVANAAIAVREASARETMRILLRGMQMFGKYRNILKVKCSRHSQRYYRVDVAQCRRELETSCDGPDAVEDSAVPRIEAIEQAYMERPDSPAFDNLSFADFCQKYEFTPDPPGGAQRLPRWQMSSGKGYIKARREIQAIRKTPRMRSDPADSDYCFSEVFLNVPWRNLQELPHSDVECVAAFHAFQSTNLDVCRATRQSIERQTQLDLLRESRVQPLGAALPPSEWSFAVDNDTDLRQEFVDVDSRADSQESYGRYSLKEIARAEQFFVNEVRPFVRSEQDVAAKGAHGAQFHQLHEYPIDSMCEDQWIPFALCMCQSRARKAAQENGSRIEPLRMIITGEGGTGKTGSSITSSKTFAMCLRIAPDACFSCAPRDRGLQH